MVIGATKLRRIFCNYNGLSIVGLFNDCRSLESIDYFMIESESRWFRYKKSFDFQSVSFSCYSKNIVRLILNKMLSPV